MPWNSKLFKSQHNPTCGKFHTCPSVTGPSQNAAAFKILGIIVCAIYKTWMNFVFRHEFYPQDLINSNIIKSEQNDIFWNTDYKHFGSRIFKLEAKRKQWHDKKE
jgi:hypothetical protein